MRFALACSLFALFVLASKRAHEGNEDEEKFRLTIKRSRTLMRGMANVTVNFLQAIRSGDHVTVANMIGTTSGPIKLQAFRELLSEDVIDVELIKIVLNNLGQGLRRNDGDCLEKLMDRAISDNNVPLFKLASTYISPLKLAAHFLTACRSSSVEIIKLLIEEGVNPGTCENQALRNALNSANFSAALLLLQYPEVDAQLLFEITSPAVVEFSSVYGPILLAAVNGDLSEFEAAMLADINTQKFPYPYSLEVYEAILGIIKSYRHVELGKFVIQHFIKNEQDLNAVRGTIIDEGAQKCPNLLTLIKSLDKVFWSFLRPFQAYLDMDTLGNIQGFLTDLIVEEIFNN